MIYIQKIIEPQDLRKNVAHVPTFLLLLGWYNFGLAGVGLEAGFGPGSAELVDAERLLAAGQSAVVAGVAVVRAAQTVHTTQV